MSPRPAAIFSVASMLACVLLGGACSSPPGPPLASLDILSGEPFELRFASNGQKTRVFVDLACDACSFPVDGSMSLSSGGKVIETVGISAGTTKHGGRSAATRALEAREVLEADAQPTGAEMTLTGVLSVSGDRDFLLREVRKDAPPPRVRVLRVWVAN